MIYPIFLPHAGCPFQCVYCNQRAVVSNHCCDSDILESVKLSIDRYANQAQRSGRPGEIAFFGGTFTALAPTLIESLLAYVSEFVNSGTFNGIRFSTRPDCLQNGVMNLLAKFPIRTVELGVQSLSDAVLQKSGRGYCANAVYTASRSVKNAGWKLGIQLMAGLPGDSQELFMSSINKAIELGPDFLRIYPTLVLSGTVLADRFKSGVYSAMSLDEAVEWLSAAYDRTLTAGIDIIRMGLQPDTALEKPGVLLAGPYHPALGYLVKSRWWRDRIDSHFASLREFCPNEILLLVTPNQISEVIGHRRSNLGHWKNRWNMSVNVAGDPDMRGTGQFRIVATELAGNY